MKNFSLCKIFLTIFLSQNFMETESVLETKSRIFGDTYNAVQFPWHVAIRLDGDRICNGALTSTEWVITTAQCALEKNIIDIWIGYDEMDENKVAKRNVSETYVHPEYDDKSRQHDIALLRLSEAVELNRETEPALIMSVDNEKFIGDGLSPTSFGPTERGSDKYSNQLKYAYFKVISNEDCAKMYKDGQIFDTMLCGVSYKGPKGSETGMCKEDAGAPSTIYFKSKHPLLALFITSGDNCTDPLIFTRVPSYVEWINKTMATPLTTTTTTTTTTTPKPTTTTPKPTTTTSKPTTTTPKPSEDICSTPLFPPDFSTLNCF